MTIFYGGRQSGKTEKLVRALARCLAAGDHCVLYSRNAFSSLDIVRRADNLISPLCRLNLEICSEGDMLSYHVTNETCLFVDTDNANFAHFIRRTPKKLFYTLEAT